MKRYLVPVSAAVIFTFLALPATAENYYRWVDKNGRPVYSHTPPPKGVDYSVESTTSNAVRHVSGDEGAVPPKTAPTAGNDFVQASRAKQAAKKSPDACRRAQDNLAALDRGVQIKMRDHNGDLKILSEEEKSVQRQKAADTIAVHCD